MNLRNEPIEIKWDTVPENVQTARMNVKIIFYRCIDILIECLFFIFLLAFAIVDTTKKYKEEKRKEKEVK